MRTNIEELLSSLRERVKSNLGIIHRNELIIRGILNEPLGDSRSKKLDERFALSRRILAENKDSLELQASIVSFLAKHRRIPIYTDELVSQENSEPKLNANSNPSSIKSQGEHSTPNHVVMDQQEGTNKQAPPSGNQLSIERLVELAISGEANYNAAHPLFGNDEFLDKLINSHAEREEYERCAELLRMKLGK